METIFVACGAGGPQLKRNPLGRTHSMTSNELRSKDAVLGFSLFWAGAVAAQTFLACLLIWAAPSLSIGLFPSQSAPSIPQQFGKRWLLVPGALAVSLIIALFASPKWTRRLAIAWCGSVLLLAVDAMLAFGVFPVFWFGLPLFLLAAVTVIGISDISRRAA